MRSSKSRSRSKSNRPRSMGNIVNRVFDSSGPEGKVRGTPQQIIDKYLILARDAQLSNDRVAAENFLQHAEHYLRMLGEAQREMGQGQDQRRDDEDRDGSGSSQSNGQSNGNGRHEHRNSDQRHDNRQNPQGGHQGNRQDQNRDDHGNRQHGYRPESPAETNPPETPDANAVIEVAADEGGSTLVETPEAAPERESTVAAPQAEASPAPSRNRRRSAPKDQPALFDAPGEAEAGGDAPAAPAEPATPAEKPKRRYTRKPKAEGEKKSAAE
ncbi:DUF4167 domain-containing protein [Halodurantibacterium flavum]|uniref:DUF4167 domain-containing protein n=1 Tax=Halodurantibacterium flavum TaxID=1382802 RepID=A0ABW4S431_9RHOB